MCRDLKDPSCEIINMLDQIPNVIVEMCHFQNISKKSQFNHKRIWQYTDISPEQEFATRQFSVCLARELSEMPKTELPIIV